MYVMTKRWSAPYSAANKYSIASMMLHADMAISAMEQQHCRPSSASADSRAVSVHPTSCTSALIGLHVSWTDLDSNAFLFALLFCLAH